MGAAFLQGTHASDNSGTVSAPAATWPGAVGAGHLLVVVANIGTLATQYTGATCSDGRETWTQVLFKSSTGQCQAVMFIAKNSLGGAANAVTVTFTGGTSSSTVVGIALMEYSGLDRINPLVNANAGGGGTATSGNTGPIALSSQPQLVVAACCQYNNPGMTWTADSAHGFAFREQDDVGTTEVADNLAVNGASVTPSFMWSAPHVAWLCLGASFLPASQGTAARAW